MKNKFLSSLLAVLMALSCFSAVSISAENVLPSNIGTDFEAIPLSQRTDNAITDPYGWGNTGLPAGWGWSTTNGTNNGGNYTISSYVATSQYEDVATAKHAAQGLLFSKDKFDTSIYSGGATLVFSASVLSHNTNNPKLTWGMYQNNKKSILPMEYPTRADGFETSSTAWKRFGATVAIPEDCDELGNTLFSFGFSKLDAPASSNYAVNINASSMYLAVEAASDIKVSSDKTAIVAGSESISVNADIVNQVGSTGTLSQDVTWYALDSTRATQITGINIVAGTDGTATVTAAESVAAGDYYIVAVSDNYSELRKGIKISVTAPTSEPEPEPEPEPGEVSLVNDFVPVPLLQRTDNAITDATGWGQNYGGLTGFAETVSQDTYTITAAGVVSNYDEDVTAKHAADGLQFSKSKFDTSIYSGGATLVFSADVISHNTNNPKLTWGMYQHNKKSILPIEYPTRNDGFETSSTEWRKFGATVHIPEDCDVLGNTLFAFGFSKDSRTVNKAVNIKRSSMYLAREAASDIIVSADRTSCIAGENTVVTVDADILNQVGNKGYLSQEVTWYVTNEERTEILSGFDITYRENGTATIAIPTTTAKGKYAIVAMSDINSSLVKGIPFTIASFDDYVPGDPNEGNVLTADTTYSMTYHPQFAEYDEYFTLSHGENVTVNGRPVQGFAIGNYDTIIFEPGNTVLFRAKIKATKGAPKFNWGLMSTANTAETAVWPNEYNGRGLGELITETEGYQEYVSKLVVPEGYSMQQANFGMPSTPEGETETTRAMEILKDGMYLGLERMYDIRVSADTYTWIPGKTAKITVDADILNQFGIASDTLNQNVSFRAFNEGRTASVSGIDIVPVEGDGSKAEIVVDLFTVEAGRYEIVAISDANSEFVRGITIEVAEATDYIAKTERVDSPAGIFKAMAKLLDCSDDAKNINAVACLVMLDASGKVIGYKYQAITDTFDGGRQETTEYCSIPLTNDADKVLLFLLDCGDTQTPTIFDAKTCELTRMKEFSIN